MPFFFAMLFKDSIQFFDSRDMKIVKTLKEKKDIDGLYSYIHNYFYMDYEMDDNNSCIWQPAWAADFVAGRKMFINDAIEPEICDVVRFYKLHEGDGYSANVLREYGAGDGKDIKCRRIVDDNISTITALIRYQSILRRFMKGEVGLQEILMFCYIIIGAAAIFEKNGISQEEIENNFAFFFDCVDMDYLEPVPDGYVVSNREAISWILGDKGMCLDERIRKMGMNVSPTKQACDAIDNMSFIGGFDFFHNQSKKNTNAMLEAFWKGINESIKTPQALYIYLNNLRLKKISVSGSRYKCYHLYKPFVGTSSSFERTLCLKDGFAWLMV